MSAMSEQRGSRRDVYARGTGHARVRIVAAGLLSLLAMGGACQRSQNGALSAMGADNTEAVLVMLSEARAWQRRADLLLIDGDVAGAIAAVKEVLEIRFPPNMAEAEDVRLDASVRLAR